MKQSKLMSWVETCTNTAVGFGISLAAQIFFLPLLGVLVELHQNIAFAMIMTVISIARGYLMRRIFEALHIRVPMPASILAIAAERRRQIEVEGWNDAHDEDHLTGELAQAAACYAMAPTKRLGGLKVDMPPNWPWSPEWWKPVDNRRDLIRAGALIAAELDKADRKRKQRKAA